MNKLLKYFHTIKHLRLVQIRYQIWYRIRGIYRKLTGFTYKLSDIREGTLLNFKPWIDKPQSFEKRTFTYLNIKKELSKQFADDILYMQDEEITKLWRYNLYYMDYLLQPEMDKKTGIHHIETFMGQLPKNLEALEPYPVALRCINWIKFLSKHSINNTKISSSLFAQYYILQDNLEFHLMGNHLLEDGFSLLYGAFYFKDQNIFKVALKILNSELREQILDDGAHFELSPMYHQVILERLLDCINLVQNNQIFTEQSALLHLMQDKAGKMLAWLNNITLSNGWIPLFNDSAVRIAPTTEQLRNYAKELNIQEVPLNLTSSGYRRYNGTNFECIVDVGPVGASYQPGHAHADTFNFVLNFDKKPLIVDTGISTYDAGETRSIERGTAAHNTVTVNNLNSSNVWSSFRVAQRAKVKIIKDEKTIIEALHDGYNRIGVIHRRTWKFEKDKILINDIISGHKTECSAHFHFAPGLIPEMEGEEIRIDNIQFMFNNADIISMHKSQIPDGYNNFVDNINIDVHFKKELTTIITINHN